jgi:hypothetical protein
MKLPRVRFTVRRMMVLGVIVGIALGFVTEMSRRRDRDTRLAAYHAGMRDQKRRLADERSIWAENAKGQWHEGLWKKYREASRRPWLPISADPPEPE